MTRGREMPTDDPLPILETPCERCEGSGQIQYGGGDGDRCPICDGAGHEPTPLGERFLSLMRHNLPSFLQDASRR
jgi:hypothetical protein